MLRRTLMKLSFVAIVAAQLLSVAPAPAAAQAGTETYVSPSYGYSLSYDASWQVVAESSDENDVLQLTNETSFVLFVGTNDFGGDAEDCVAGVVDSFMNKAAYGDFTAATEAEGNVLVGSDATDAYAVYDYTFTNDDGMQEAWTLATQCVTLVPGEAALAIVQDVPDAAYYAERLERAGLLGGLLLTTAPASEEPAEGQDLDALVESVATDVDAFWSEAFASEEIPYSTPSLEIFDSSISTGCGEVAPETIGPFYCPNDQTIYLDGVWLAEAFQTYGVAPVVQVIAHEWGHHIQQQSGIMEDSTQVAQSLNGMTSLEIELQADCLAGTWLQAADDAGAIGPGLLEGIISFVATELGDSAETSSLAPQTQYDFQHGTGALRTWWLLQGYQVGIDACMG
jgi:predicted metalloprotease